MTPQEQQLLESLAARVAGTPAPQKDPQADALIRERLGTNPDALYILAQTVLIQEIALNQANARLHELQQLQGTQHTSFLGRLFGTPPPLPQTPPQGPPPGYAPPQYQAPSYAGSAYQQGPAYAPYAPGGGSSFLRSAAETATGVAAGALAFEGIEALLGHHGGGFLGGGGGYGGGEFLQGAPSETIINNYYDSPGGDGGQQSADADVGDTGQYDDSADASDASYDDSGDSGGGDYSSSDV